MSRLGWLALAGCVPIDGERGPCAEQAYGRFDVLEAAGASTLDGRVYDGTPPAQRVTASVQGACQLLVQPTCDAPCASGELCGVEGTCQPFPRNVEVGDLRLKLSGRDVRLMPTTPGATYFASLDDLEPGTALRLKVADDVLSTSVVEPLEASVEWRLPGSVDLRWTPSARAGSTIEVRMAVDQHGASQGELRCTFADTGEADVSADAVEALLAVGVSGFSSGSIRRQRLDHAVIEGRCVEFASVVIQPARVSVDR